MSTIACIGVNLAILFDKRVRYVNKVKNHWASTTVTRWRVLCKNEWEVPMNTLLLCNVCLRAW